MRSIKILICLCVVFYGPFSLKADDWIDKDNRLKGRTQQSRPVNPPEEFVNKRVKV